MARARLWSVCFLILTAIVFGFRADVLRADDDDPIPPLDIGNDDSLPPVPPLGDNAKPEEAKGGVKSASDPSSLLRNPSSEKTPYIPGGPPRKSDEAKADGKTAKDSLPWKKLSQAIFTQIGKMAVPGKKKEANDYFLYCIGELDVKNRHADVRFDYKLGQRETADFLTDYVLSSTETKIHRWMLLKRVKTADDAKAALAATRAQYDEAVAYREQLMKVYRATSVRRC